MKDFFETIPPYQEIEIDDMCIETQSHITSNRPEINIFCEICDGNRYFVTRFPHSYDTTSVVKVYEYYCKNCNKFKKNYSVVGQIFEKGHIKGKLMKIGEFPIFGKPIPAKVISLIGPDKDNFLKGRRCENQGLGIGSYAYYRRVIEAQKNRIIDQMIKICTLLNQNHELIEQLKMAKNEIQFSKAIGMIKQNLPDSLLINGHNPLTLLHKALSKGIHELQDDECLKRANSIRIVLTELCLKMNELLKDDNELKEAINILITPEKEPPHA